MRYIQAVQFDTTEPAATKHTKYASQQWHNEAKKPELQRCVFGLGGRDISEEDIEKLFEDLLKNKVSDKLRFIGLRE